MKALLAVIASASLLLIPAVSFAQNANGMGGGVTSGSSAPAGQQTWQQQQPAMNYQNAPAKDNIDYGMPANGTYQSGRSMSHGLTEPTFGHH
ncbi:hypothetical protein [Paraburkholderia rhizosphaerae]|uniref:PXPV repeat-containing protein n=1 Tax=Paraburkholderia rhizosphaerae TaxID=480658 RepID=A0A4R8LYG4_9BURK|nr:hypothetical protein [Paraburkholderia rhizosphaerae]TDY52266.1 hypothetical protein BX592_105150 [Paraburkholderia rhizosphaerae]